LEKKNIANEEEGKENSTWKSSRERKSEAFLDKTPKFMWYVVRMVRSFASTAFCKQILKT
jgi:hypothetical protein